MPLDKVTIPELVEERFADRAPELSVVIIARNEAENIARAIESVLCAVKNQPNTEILLVDSASMDNTVEIAKGYPINIVRLKPDWHLSAAAGRYIGTICTRGEYILYLDGDMELDANWLCRAIPFAIVNPKAAVIGGYMRNVYLSKGKNIGEEDYYHDPQDRILEVAFIGGAMLCRRSVVVEVEGFQPFISGDEEVEFCMRIRQAGYKVIRLPERICRHYCIPTTTLLGTLRRVRLNMWLGYGQVIRRSIGGEFFWPYIFKRGAFITPLAGLLVMIITLAISLFTKNIIFFGGFGLLGVMLIVVLSIKKHSIKSALITCLTRFLITYATLRGFLMVPRSRRDYPTDPEIIQVAHGVIEI